MISDLGLPTAFDDLPDRAGGIIARRVVGIGGRGEAVVEAEEREDGRAFGGLLVILADFLDHEAGAEEAAGEFAEEGVDGVALACLGLEDRADTDAGHGAVVVLGGAVLIGLERLVDRVVAARYFLDLGVLALALNGGDAAVDADLGGAGEVAVVKYVPVVETDDEDFVAGADEAVSGRFGHRVPSLQTGSEGKGALGKRGVGLACGES